MYVTDPSNNAKANVAKSCLSRLQLQLENTPRTAIDYGNLKRDERILKSIILDYEWSQDLYDEIRNDRRNRKGARAASRGG